jgi:DNA recombination protein RmuC
METALVILTGVLTVLAVVILLNQMRQSGEARAPRPPDPSLQLLQQQVDTLRGQLYDAVQQLASEVHQQIGGLKDSLAASMAENVRTIQSSGQQVGSGLGQAMQAVGEVRQQLGQLKEASERILEVGRDVSGLKDILQAPKFRGGFGEFLLEELLSQHFPREHYSTQFRFSSGEIVDAVLRLGAGQIPIDSKFPLESFRRSVDARIQGSEDEARQARRRFQQDVRKHIEDIARKYIRPQENFYDFALMYIPAENIYYEAIIRDEGAGEGASLLDAALSRRVIPVSPNTLFAYLQVIVLGLRGMKVEEAAKRILVGLRQLQVDLTKVDESFEKAGKQLQFAQANFGDAQKNLNALEQRLTLLSALPGEAAEPPAALLQRPSES